MNYYQQYVAFATILHREVARFMRIWQQTVFPPIITSSLYFIIFGSLIGSRVGSMKGFDYMEFIAPGLVLMSVISSSYANVSSSFFSAKFQRSIEEMKVAPIPNYIILLGYVCGGVLRGLLVGSVVMVIAMLFNRFSLHNVWVVLSIMLLTSLLFSLAGLLNGMFAQKFDDVTVIPNFVLTPLIYLGGIFYSINLLPSFWYSVSHANPILYMINAFRYGFLGISDISLAISYSLILLFCSALFLVNLRLLNSGYGICK